MIHPRTILMALLMAGGLCRTTATDYYVSPAGNDGAAGTEIGPFRTIAKAVSVLKAGDVCILRAGRYTEVVKLNGLKGQQGKPITIRAYPGERVVLDGAMPIRASWKKWRNNIYRCTLPRNVWQLFADEELVQVARWPNASFKDGSIWRMEACMRYTDRTIRRGKPLGRTKEGEIHDQNPKTSVRDISNDEGASQVHALANVNQQTLAETGIDFTGAIAVLNTGNWLTWARYVTQHKAGQNFFRYNAKNTTMKRYPVYYMLGLQCLDHANEWWFDHTTKTAYIHPGDRTPEELKLRGKVRDYNLVAANCAHIRIEGITFFATTFDFESCDHMVVEDCRLLYPSTNKFLLGGFAWFSGKRRSTSKTANVMTRIYNNGNGPFTNAIRNCEIAYPNSPAIYVNSPGSVIENCYIHHIEWDVNSSGGSGSLQGGPETILRRNPIHTAGGSEGIRPGRGSIIEYNRVYNMGLLQHDGSAINLGTRSQTGSSVRFNWVHDTNRQGIRFDSTGGGHGEQGVIMRNVMVRLANGAGGSKVKGNRHIVANNTVIGKYIALPKKYGKDTGHNTQTITRNNLSDYMYEWNHRTSEKDIPGKCDHNLTGPDKVSAALRDPANWDFRPRKGSPVVDAGAIIAASEIPGKSVAFTKLNFVGKAPDIGAYEFGDTGYWIPGRKQPKPSTPIPPDGSTTVKPDADLMWLGAYKATAHYVYFGTDRSTVAGATGASASKTNIFSPGALTPGRTYYWRVDAVTPNGRVKGDVWTFTVK